MSSFLFCTKRIFITLIAIALTFSACKNNAKKQAEQVVFTFEKTGCFGECPTYTLKVYNTGKLEMIGTQFVDKLGKYELALQSKEVLAFEAELKEMGFCEMEEEYGKYVSDVPASIITYNCYGNEKTVEAKMDIPKNLLKFINKLDSLRNRDGWKAIDPSNSM